MTNNTIDQIRDMIQQQNTRSAWLSGVQVYALELLDEYANNYGVNACAPSLRALHQAAALILSCAREVSAC